MKQNLKNMITVSLVVPSLLMMTGCGRNIGASNYASAGVGESMTSYAGVIASKRQVLVQEGDKLQDNVIGGVAGGVAGGFLGNTLGGGRGNTLATVGGVAAGALAGAYAQKELSKQEAFEYTIQLDNGQLKTVVQGLDVNLHPGQRVILHVSYKGRSRIVPFQG
tara:strand:- start:513 stop:1004 length:492 start_codon:yes stop_codon:yes gene_type:complete